jgi:molybdopterin-guanine dinucleotide biosynthesis protein A
MGRTKALLPFAGEPLIAHIVGRLRPLFGDVVVVAAREQELPALPATVVRDEVAYQGPVAGILYGLRAARGELSFVTSCDAAFASGPLLSHLLSLAPDLDVVVPRWDGRFQPLFAMYRRTVVPALEAQLARGELRPVSLFDRVRTRVVTEDEVRRFDPAGDSFFNMNTPADYQEALRRWQRDDAEAGFSRPDTRSDITCTVELPGAAHLLTGGREITLDLRAGATVADALAALAAGQPALAGSVIDAATGSLVDGCTCNLNGRDFIRNAAAARLHQGDRIILRSATRADGSEPRRS